MTNIDIKQIIREELHKQLNKKNKLNSCSKDLYDSVKLVEELKNKKSSKLPMAQKTLVIAEGNIREFFEEDEYFSYLDNVPDELNFDSDDMSMDDNGDTYDTLLSIMECAKDMYMKIDIDTEVNEWLSSKIHEAEVSLRMACEYLNQEFSHARDEENLELSDEYIATDDLDDESDI